MTCICWKWNVLSWVTYMSDHPTEMEKRLEEVREEIRRLVEVPPHLRNYAEWQRLVEEESRLMRLIAEDADSQ